MQWYALQCCLILFLVGEACGRSMLQDVRCRSAVTIDRTANVCQTLRLNTTEQTCNDLQSALVQISSLTYSKADCFQVTILPGKHVLSQRVRIQRNILIRGVSDVEISFESSFDPTNVRDPFYIITITNATFAEISGISFQNSPGIIAIENVSNVLVYNSNFSYFYQGAVDIFNCIKVEVSSCLFAHNGPAAIIKDQAYRGHAGGLSVGYDFQRMLSTSPEAVLSDNTFCNNTAIGLPSSERTTTQVLDQFLFTGRGGGCSVLINSTVPVSVEVQRCTFEENYAMSFGGGLYIAFGALASHTVTVNNSRFLRSRTLNGGGGILIFYVEGGSANADVLRNSVLTYNSEFFANEAGYGGGVYIILGARRVLNGSIGNFAKYKNCTFRDNEATEFGGGFGSIIPAASIIFESRENIQPLEFDNCSFIGNDGGRGGALSTAYFPLRFDGVNVFQGNKGRTIAVLGALIHVYGTLQFVANVATGTDGGALYSTSLGQLKLFDGAVIQFERNIGNLGSALVLDNPRMPQLFSPLPYNPLCFLLLDNSTQSFNDVDTIAISFSGNKAVVGSDVYADNLALCSWVGLREPYFNASSAYRWSFVNHSDDNSNTVHVGDEFNPLWYVQTPATQLNIQSDAEFTYPGESFNLGVMALDELGEQTSAVLRLSDGISFNAAEQQHVFNSSVVTHDAINGNGIGIAFQALSSDSLSLDERIFAETLLAESVLYYVIIQSSNTVTVAVRQCPAGYLLLRSPSDELTFTCQCNPNNSDIMSCDNRRIQLTEGLWGAVANVSGREQLVTYPCPRDYCRCQAGLQSVDGLSVCASVVDTADVNSQCSCGREGFLCGSCQDGEGFSALFGRCVTCSDASSLLLVVLIVLDVVLFVGFLLLLPKMPSWVYPCIFYLQIVPYLTEHFPLTFDHFHRPVRYVTSALSFYFVYDFCLFHNMSPLASYFLQLLPLILSLVVCPIVLFLRRKVIDKYYQTHSPWHGLWWIVLLQYPHVVYTAMSILNCPSLPGSNGEYAPRWYISGDVKCFHGWHAPLGILAIGVLLLCVGLIPLAVLIALERIRWLNRLENALVFEKYQWWGAVELARRLLLLVLVVPFPRNDYPAIFVIMIMMVLYGYVQPYDDRTSTLLEAVLSINVLVLLLLRNINQLRETLGVLFYPVATVALNQTECSLIAETKTRFAWTLFPFYYVPLVVGVAATICWIITKLWLLKTQLALQRTPKHETHEQESFVEDRGRDNGAVEFSVEYLPQRAYTVSVIDIGGPQKSAIQS